MLQAMRTSAQSLVIKILIFGLLILAMTGLVFLDVRGVFSGGAAARTVARIGREKIRADQLEHMVESASRERNIPRELAGMIGLPQQLLAQEVSGRVFAKAARDEGLVPDETAAGKRIGEMLEPYLQNGMNRKEALQALLSGLGMSEPQLVSVIRSQIAVETLQRAVTSGALPPQRLADDAARFQREQRRAEYFLLTPAQAAKNAPAATEAELKAFYEANAARFSTPERRTLRILSFGAGKTGSDEAEATLNDLVNHVDDLLAGGGTLDEAAEAAKAKPVELSGVDRQGLPASGKAPGAEIPGLPKILEKGFALQQGETSTLVETPDGGYAAVSPIAVEMPKIRPFAEVRAEVAAAVKEKTGAEALAKALADIQSRLQKGDPLEKLAAAHGQSLLSTPFLPRGADAAKLGLDKALPDLVFSLEKTPAAIRAEKGVIAARLSATRVDESKPLNAEEKGQIASALRRDYEQSLLAQYRDALLGKYDVEIDDEAVKTLYAPKLNEAQE